MRYTINYSYLILAILSLMVAVSIIAGFAQTVIHFSSIASEMFTAFFAIMLLICSSIMSFTSKK